ncbi:ABC transporter ATP-binding protein [Muricoccus pecuniae]|uniref:Osmoprotectant transport system ATP-binding protein n=1 Tax=Muricoccus pecuniae TaxID=693023 RepID=A0A840YKK0_9PROT|nr:ABC transporter ATP-binding protein [Roseomonas pecuniae]MBB5694734.1 osmoprotectant transport system ATP-binding protein [Roseomonas pecuniae]
MIRFEGAGRRYGEVRAVRDVSFEVPRGSLCVLLGESGSGKSTLMRMVNRLVEPDAGRVLLEGRDVAGLDPQALRRGIGYVIQSVGLFPHWDVARNVATVPRLLGWDEGRVAARVEELLALVGLDPATFGGRRPATLSGGQAQRVGLARALAADPPVLLMDEPFSALDPATRRGLQAELRRIHRETGKTILLVTHDVEEALALADRIAVMEAGSLAAEGPALAVLGRDAPPAVQRMLRPEALAFQRLGVLPAAAFAEAGPVPGAPGLPGDATLRDALLLMLAEGTDRVSLEGAAPRHLTVAGVLAAPWAETREAGA